MMSFYSDPTSMPSMYGPPQFSLPSIFQQGSGGAGVYSNVDGGSSTSKWSLSARVALWCTVAIISVALAIVVLWQTSVIDNPKYWFVSQGDTTQPVSIGTPSSSTAGAGAGTDTPATSATSTGSQSAFGIPWGTTPTTPTQTTADNAFFPLTSSVADSTGKYQGLWVPQGGDSATCLPSLKTTTLPNGQTGRALYTPCSSAHQYLDLGGIIPGDSYTTCAWYNPTSLPAQESEIVLTSAPPSTSTGGFLDCILIFGGNFDIAKYQQSEQNAGAVMSSGGAYVGQWAHICTSYTSSANTAQLYYNGAAITNAYTTTLTWAGTTKLRYAFLGPWLISSNGVAFQGYAYNLYLNNTALTTSQVLALYNSGLSV